MVQQYDEFVGFAERSRCEVRQDFCGGSRGTGLRVWGLFFIDGLFTRWIVDDSAFVDNGVVFYYYVDWCATFRIGERP
jgi:hypothetical protein